MTRHPAILAFPFDPALNPPPDLLTGCCHHHRRTLTSWRECWDHEAAEGHAERVAAIRRQCCDVRGEP